jgi:hypothetical protein
MTMMISRSSYGWLSFLTTTTIIMCVMASPGHAQQAFKSSDDAASALADAVRSGAAKDILKVLGPDGADIIDSGDDVSDIAARDRFLDLYNTKHTIKSEGDKKACLILGADDFPFPVPLVKRSAGWEFDAAAGRQEILYRRIGRNELDAIQTSLAYVDAQNEYAGRDRMGNGSGIYAQRIVSSPGQKDGLYWPSQGGSDESPLGEFAARASAQGYKIGSGPAPYHGYYYRILTRQGPHAAGGTLNYIVNGKMIGGFALVAHPAEYGNSGVMTFLVNLAGAVFEKAWDPKRPKSPTA